MARVPSTILLACLLAAAGSCAPENRAPPPRIFGAGQTTPQGGGVLRFAVVDDVRNLDPAIGYDEFSIVAEHFLFDTLLGYGSPTADDALELRPQLAERWEVSPDGRRYTFTLREGVTFSDGQPLLAEDFVYAIDRCLDPSVGSPAQQFFTGIVGAEQRLEGKATHTAGLRARDARTLEIELVEPDASFPMVLAMKFATPQKRSHVEAVGEQIRRLPLGTGPFVLVSWKEGDSLTFARNPRYWRKDIPYLDGIVMYLLVPRDVAVLKFLRGELDTVDRLSSDEYLRFAQTPAWAPYLEKTVQMNVYGELMDVTRPPFDDRRVRQAMNYAIRKQDTIKLYNGRAVIAHGILPPGMPGYDPAIAPYPHDPEKARRLLAEAGYPNGFEITYTTTKDEIAEKLAQSMQADLAEVGVRMRIELVTFPTYLDLVGRRRLPFAYTAWFMDFPDPWNFLEVKFHSRMIADENSNNDTGYANPEVDRLLDAARVEQDRDRRLALYRQAERILIEDCPWIFHYHSMTVEVRQPYVMNYRQHPVWTRDYREAWLDEPRRRAAAP